MTLCHLSFLGDNFEELSPGVTIKLMTIQPSGGRLTITLIVVILNFELFRFE